MVNCYETMVETLLIAQETDTPVARRGQLLLDIISIEPYWSTYCHGVTITCAYDYPRLTSPTHGAPSFVIVS